VIARIGAAIFRRRGMKAVPTGFPVFIKHSWASLSALVPRGRFDGGVGAKPALLLQQLQIVYRRAEFGEDIPWVCLL
jgi:hypothetical protein